jgi:TorA maturation chaperone TorD
LEELAIEYTRLFIGPKNPPAVPYASFYLSESRALMTDETIAVRQAYLDAGMEVKKLHSIPDDHIGTELEFLFYLTEKITELHEAGLGSESSRLYEMRESFLRNHCVLWFPELAKKIQDNTDSAFYRGAAQLLAECVEGV